MRKGTVIQLNCSHCKKVIFRKPFTIKSKNVFCSVPCKSQYFWSLKEHRELQTKVHKGYIPTSLPTIIAMSKTPEGRKRVSDRMKGKPAWSKGLIGIIKHSEETKRKMSEDRKGKTPLNVLRGDFKGEKNFRWIKDRTKLKDDHHDRGGSLSRDWSRQVKNRDGWKCHFNNKDCSGRMEAHHILGWTAFPNLKYEIDNGITLCHFHHPRKREEEVRMSPYFQEIIKTLKQ